MKVFIAGPRSVSRLNEQVKTRIGNVLSKGFTILVGDANGVDKQVQAYCHTLNYKNVSIYASNGKARNNVGEWKVHKVEVPSSTKGFDFYAAKDLKMAEEADYGFMIWNGKSKGTLNNIINLIKLKKSVLVYFIPHKKFYNLNNEIELNYFLDIDKKGDSLSKSSEDTVQITSYDLERN